MREPHVRWQNRHRRITPWPLSYMVRSARAVDSDEPIIGPFSPTAGLNAGSTVGGSLPRG